MGLALDLDGVVWLGEQPIPGAAEAVAKLRAAGHDIVPAADHVAPNLLALTPALLDLG